MHFDRIRFGARTGDSDALRCSIAAAVLTLTALWTGVAAAARTPAPPPFLQSLIDAGKVELVRSFPTDKPGLTGYVVRHDGREELVFGEGGYLLVGQVFSPQGENLMARYSLQYLPRPDVSATVRRLESTGHLIVEGPEGAPVLYVFADPDCGFCHRLFRLAEPLVQAGRLQLRWAMVGFLTPDSAGRAAAILTAKHPLRALHDNEAQFSSSQGAGGIAPAKHTDPATRAVLESHLHAMHSVGGNGTPTILYQTGPGTWAASVGVPKKAWLSAYAVAESGERK